MSNPDKIPGQSYRVRPEASAELDLLSALLRCGTAVECGRAVAAGLLREFGGLAGVSAADSSALIRAGLTGRAAAAIGRARSLAVAMARVEACRRPVLSSWAALVAYLRATMAYAPREQFRVRRLQAMHGALNPVCTQRLPLMAAAATVKAAWAEVSGAAQGWSFPADFVVRPGERKPTGV